MGIGSAASTDIEEEADGQWFGCGRGERLDLLLDFVFEKMKIAGLEIGDGLAVLVERDKIHGDRRGGVRTTRWTCDSVRSGWRQLRWGSSSNSQQAEKRNEEQSRAPFRHTRHSFGA
jgi:hypothetical protein